MSSRVGIREVASLAGVSVATVSNAMNRPDRVSKSTRDRIFRAIDDSGFVRNDLARQLKMGSGTTVGMVVLSVANPFYADLAHFCEIAAEEAGYMVILGSSDQLDDREARYIDLFEEQRVFGMILATVNGISPRIDRLIRHGTPLVLFDDGTNEGEFCSVGLDGTAGGHIAAQHLIHTGRRRLAFVGGPRNQVEDRLVGAMKAIGENPGVEFSYIETADQNVLEGRAVGGRIAAMPTGERPDGVFAANDLLALGIMQSLLLDSTIEVPRDVAIVGFDDIDYAETAIVPLTTIRQPKSELASEAIRMLLDHAELRNLHVHEHRLLIPRLVARRSSADR